MTPNSYLPRLTLTALLFTGASGLIAQQQTAPPAAAPSGDAKPAHSLRSQAREVQLAVTVRDKKGVLVPTVDKNDFSLTEDGRPQVIQSFTRDPTDPWKLGLLVETARPVSA